MTKRKDKRDRSIIMENKKLNAPKADNARVTAAKTKAHKIAYIIHDSLHLTFGQCVQIVLTNHKDGYLIANRNIRKYNLRHANNPHVAPLAEFDAETFNKLYGERVEFAMSAKNWG